MLNVPNQISHHIGIAELASLPLEVRRNTVGVAIGALLGGRIVVSEEQASAFDLGVQILAAIPVAFKRSDQLTHGYGLFIKNELLDHRKRIDHRRHSDKRQIGNAVLRAAPGNAFCLCN